MAEASILEEPGAGNLHARIRAGAVGQLAVLPRWPGKVKTRIAEIERKKRDNDTERTTR